jgi:hypothetical protein
MKITINEEELRVLVEACKAEGCLLSIPAERLDDKSGYILVLSEDDANTFRDVCGEHLPLVGFDDDYNPNAKGLVLENLIDKFFVP